LSQVVMRQKPLREPPYKTEGPLEMGVPNGPSVASGHPGPRLDGLRTTSTPSRPSSFCDDLSHWQAAHLQGATKRQADHGEGADQHADRYHSAFEVAHTWQRITKGPPLGTTSPTDQKERC